MYNKFHEENASNKLKYLLLDYLHHFNKYKLIYQVDKFIISNKFSFENKKIDKNSIF